MSDIMHQPKTSVTSTIRIEPSSGWLTLDLRSVWAYRELLYFLAWRDVKVRYKQTVLGIAWAVIQPLITMAIFTVIFSYIGRFPSDGLPYPIFAYSGLIAWIYFATAVTQSGNSLRGDVRLIEKIYFPRLIIPLSTVITPLMDFLCSLLVLLGMMYWFGITPTWNVLFLPFFLLVALLTAFSVSLWLAPLNLMYRDIGHTIPFVIQIWMYASPLVYPVSVIPDKWQLLYSLNPMVGVIEGFRWALLGHKSTAFDMMTVSGIVVISLMWCGLIFFRRMERTFADVV